ncbi:MAG: hypothetical protein ACPLZG_12910 [Thermoproteota archaeon]
MNYNASEQPNERLDIKLALNLEPQQIFNKQNRKLKILKTNKEWETATKTTSSLFITFDGNYILAKNLNLLSLSNLIHPVQQMKSVS